MVVGQGRGAWPQERGLRMQQRVNRLREHRIGRRGLIEGTVAAGMMAGLGGIDRRTALAAQSEAPTGVLQLGGESEPAGTWLPFRAAGGAETQVFDLVFSRLIRFDADYTLIPD